jgi:hypothetical protein
MIVAPHPVCAIRGGEAHRAVVTRARRVLAPPLVATQGLQRNAGRAGPRTVRSIIAPEQRKPSCRRAFVALALDPDDSRRPKRARDAKWPSRQPAARAVSCDRSDAEEGEAMGHIHPLTRLI